MPSSSLRMWRVVVNFSDSPTSDLILGDEIANDDGATIIRLDNRIVAVITAASFVYEVLVNNDDEIHAELKALVTPTDEIAARRRKKVS